jgi:hypothetical protein
MPRAAASLMRLVACCVFAGMLAACASREVLIPKSATVPPAVDFSGTWRLRGDVNADQRRIDDAIRRTDGVRDGIIPGPLDVPDERRAGSRTQRSTGGLVHVFFQNGETLKITQTADGLFLSFDRSVVVEYRFGEHRVVRVGPVLAERVSGWDAGHYVAETLDEKGMKLTERFALPNHHSLQRTITFRGKNDEAETIVQTFDRIG